jgi:hypothetical protein
VPATGMEPTSPTVRCPSEIYATVYKALGIDWTKTYMSPIARPVYIANGFEDTAGISKS